MAVITYTNASVDDIKEKLSDSIVITPNIFIGTIHSFLMHYFIMPHADSLGYNVANVLVVDKLSMKGFEWIDSWVEQSNPEKDKKEKQDIKLRLMQSRRNNSNASDNSNANSDLYSSTHSNNSSISNFSICCFLNTSLHLFGRTFYKEAYICRRYCRRNIIACFLSLEIPQPISLNTDSLIAILHTNFFQYF